jgi:hypothetical protein
MASSLYISLLAIVFLILTIRVIKVRKSLKISLGDGGDFRLQRVIRAQANFCESVPLAVTMLILAEASSVNILIIHFCGGALLLGRIIHAIAIGSVTENIKIRITGMVLTFISITILSLLNLLAYVVSVLGIK